MKIDNNTIINVYSYSPCTVIASSNVQDYIFEPCEDTNAPIVNPMSAVEIKNIHSRSTIFRDGYLTFDDEDKKDVYEYLRINNWEDILTQEDIIDTIQSCTKDKLQKIIDITSVSYFERVRGIYVALKQAGVDISIRVANVIETRYKELVQGKIKSSIQLKDVILPSDLTKEDELNKQIAEKDEQLDSLTKQLQELQQMVSQLVKEKESVVDTSEDKNIEKPQKKRGRPPKGE